MKIDLKAKVVRVPLSLRVHPQTLADVKKAAKENGLLVSQVVEHCIIEFMSRRAKK